MKRLLILALVAAAIGITDWSKVVCAQESKLPVTQSQTRLEVSILSSKHVYKLNEQFKMLVMVMNAGKKEVYVVGNLEWGPLASLSFHIQDSSGREIRPRAFPDDQTLVARDDKSSFVKLLPSHFIGTDFYAPLNLLGLDRPGKYSIFVEYHSPISSTDTEMRPFWGRENDPIKSKEVYFEVVR